MCINLVELQTRILRATRVTMRAHVSAFVRKRARQCLLSSVRLCLYAHTRLCANARAHVAAAVSHASVCIMMGWVGVDC